MAQPQAEPSTQDKKPHERKRRAPTKTARQPSASRGSSNRSRNSRNAGRIRQELILTGNVQGGYDDNVGQTLGSGAGSVPPTPTSGSTALADAMFEYFRGNDARGIRVRSLGNLQMYPGYLAHPVAGAKVRFSGYTDLGLKQTLTFSSQVRDEPWFTTGLVEEVAGVPGGVADAGQPPAAGGGVPAAGLFVSRSWVNSTKADLTRKWSRRDTTRVAYNFFVQHFTDNSSQAYYHDAGAEYWRSLNRAVNLRASYRYLTGRQTDGAGVSRPHTEQTLQGGSEFTKILARQRKLSLSFGAGATHMAAVNEAMVAYVEWVPTASASASLDVTQTLSLSGGYHRGFTAMQGLTSQFYATDNAVVRMGSRVTSRINASLGGTFANGGTLGASGAYETFKVYGATLGASVALTSKTAVTADYFYYYQRYSNPASLPTGFPARYHRNALRVGLTFWLGLAGTTSARPRLPQDW